MSKLLIIVDMIKGFVTEGAMHDKGIANIIPKIKNYIENFNNSGDKVLFIKDAHEDDAVEFNAFPKHCLKGTSESELVDELMVYENGSNYIEKNSTSAMFAPGFVEYINSLEDLTEVVIGGCCTDICVLNLAISFFSSQNIYRKVFLKSATRQFFLPICHMKKFLIQIVNFRIFSPYPRQREVNIRLLAIIVPTYILKRKIIHFL